MIGVVLALMLVQPERQPLSGPAVAKPAGALVDVDMTGRVRRPEKTIEEEVVGRLELSPEVRERVEKVLNERAAAIDRFVVENLQLLNQAQTVAAAGTLLEKATLVVEGLKGIAPAVGGKTLKERIVSELPADEAEKFRAMLREYWRALEAEGAAVKPKDPPPPWAVYFGETLASLGREVGKSFERQLAAGTLFVDYLTSGLNLTEKQRELFRTMKLELLEKTNMKPSEEDQKKLVLGVVAYLNEEQRGKVMGRIGTGRANRR
jgi:hypothetical protein